MRCLALALPCCLAFSLSARAQQQPQLGIPASVVALNLDRTFAGVWESLEAGATRVRCDDAAAIWYNPAGLAGVNRSTVAASAPSYDFSGFTGSQPVSGFGSRGLPNFAGAVLGNEVVPWENVRIGVGVSNPLFFSAGPSYAATDSTGVRTTYTDNSSLSSFEALAAIGYAPFPEHLRLGAYVGVSYDQLSVSSQSSSGIALPITQGSMGTAWINANAEQLVSALGVQYRLNRWFAMGGVARLPAVPLLSASTIRYDSLYNSGPEQQQLHLDTGGSFALHLPAQLELGATARWSKFVVEANLFWLVPNGMYTLLDASQPVLVVTSSGAGAKQVTTTPFPAISTSTRSVVNGSFGGNYELGARWRFHAGGYWSRAPTYAADPFFQPIDYYGVRAGVALSAERGPSGSFGLGYEYGHSDRAISGVSLPGAGSPFTNGTLDTHTVSLLLALSYGF